MNKNLKPIAIMIFVFSLLITSVLPIPAVSETAKSQSAEENEIEMYEYNYITKEESFKTIDIEALREKLGITEFLSLSDNPLSDSIANDFADDIIDGQDEPSRIIIGSDDRTQVNASNYPYSGIVHLNITFPDGTEGTGTGFMISYDIMLTAAHCMWQTSLGGNATRMEIRTKQNSTTLNTTFYFPYSWNIPAEYRNNENENYDWCIVRLQNNLGSSTGWFNVATSSGNINSKQITVSGYPSQTFKNGGTQNVNGLQFMHTGTTSNSSTYHVRYNADTSEGQSGSPVYTSDFTVWAIHSRFGTNINYGCRITSTMYTLFQSWISDSIGRWGPSSSQFFGVQIKHSNRYFDIYFANTAPGAKLIQWGTNCSTTSRQYKFILRSSNSYSITARHSGLVLEMNNYSTIEGEQVQQWGYNGGSNQLWRMQGVGNNYFMLINLYSGMAMDVIGGPMGDDMPIGQYRIKAGDNQRFKLVSV